MSLGKILLIDNNRKTKSLIEKSLKKFNYDIDLVTKGSKMKYLLNEFTYDFCLINIDLNWTDNVEELVNYLNNKFPYIGKIIFHYGVIDFKNGKLIKADALLSEIDRYVKRLPFLIEFVKEGVTERVKYLTLRKEYKELFENVPIGLYRTNYLGQIVACNEVFVKLLDYKSKEELYEKKIQDLYFDNEIKPALDANNIFLEDSPFFKGQRKLRKKNGEPIWVEIDTNSSYNNENILLHLDSTVKDITNQLELEKELEETSFTMEMYLDTVETLFVVVDNSGFVIQANKNIADFYGLSKQEIIGQKWVNLLRTEYEKERYLKAFNEVIAGNIDKYHRTEGKRLNSVGETRYILWNNSVIKNHENKVIAIVSSGTDATETMRTKELLEISDEQYKKLIQTLPDYVFVSNLEGKILYANQHLTDLLNHTENIEQQGISIKEFFPKENHPLASQILKQTIQAGFAENIECYFIGKKKEKFPVELSSALLVTKESNPWGIVAHARDITERKNAQQALIESEKLYRTIFENTGTSMLVIELGDKIVLCNTMFEELTGYSVDQLINNSWSRLVYNNDLEMLQSLSKERVENPESFPKEVEFRIRTKTGKIRNIWAVIDAIPGTNQSVASLRDVTEEKLMEDVKRISYDQIEKNLEQFAILIDSIRNPLAIITAHMDLTDNKKLSDQIIKQIEEIDGILNQIDKRSLESTAVRNFLLEHME